MTHSLFIRSFLSYLLVTSFLLTPFSTAQAIAEGLNNPGATKTAPGTNNGGFAASESLNDDEEDSEE